MVNKTNYNYFDTYLLRVPSFNFNYQELLELNEKKLIDFFVDNQQFREAIYIASKDLYSLINKSISTNSINEKLLNSLLKYFIRSKTRCTPFGLFSAFCVGYVGESTNVIIEDSSNFETNIRVDMEVVSIVIDYLLSYREIIMNIKFRPNNTIHSIGDISSYIESQTINNSEKVSFKSTFEKDIYIDSILEYSKDGKFVNDIVQFLFKEYEVEELEAEGFILDLIHNKILCSELEISTIDTNPFKTLIDKINRIEHIEDVNVQNFIKNGKALIDIFSKKNRLGIEDIEKHTKNFNLFNINSNNTFQVDLKGKAIVNSLSEKTVQNINKAIGILNLFSHYQNAALKEFTEAFYNKYEDEEVPLLSVLDDDFGFGYPLQQKKILSNLLDDISFPISKSSNVYKLFACKDIFLLRKLSQFFLDVQGKDDIELNITDEDLSFFDDMGDEDTTLLPNTLSALVEIYITQNNEEKAYVNMFSASATNLLGRFSSYDKDVQDSIREIYEKEKQIFGNDIIIAEIVHLPKYREGNVLLRPSFGTHEIPILSQSLLDNTQIIQLNDLHLSVKEGRLALRSRKHNKYILPKLSSAHNYMNPQNLSLYRFLSDFQYQNEKKYMFFDWGAVSDDFIFLPRVVYKNVILSKALWNLTKEDMKIFQSYSSNEELEEKIILWRKKYKIPEEFVLKDFDNKLYICTKNFFIFKMFLNTVKNLKKFVVEEVIYNNPLLVKDKNNNSFTNEIILNFYKKNVK